MIETRPAIAKEYLSQEEIKSFSPQKIESLYWVKLKMLYPEGVIRREISGKDRCILMNDLGLLEEVMPWQVIIADPPPSKEEIRLVQERERVRMLVEEIKYLSGLERPKGKRPTHRHPI